MGDLEIQSREDCIVVGEDGDPTRAASASTATSTSREGTPNKKTSKTTASLSTATSTNHEGTPNKKTKFRQGRLYFSPATSRSPSQTRSSSPPEATPTGASTDDPIDLEATPLKAGTDDPIDLVNSPSASIQPSPCQSVISNKETVKPKLTKKQREEQKAEKERVKAEMKAKREEERLRKEREKQLREAERREKQLKKEQELKERQEKKEREELEKKERREKREAEKRKKEEERQKKLDEKKRLEQEKELLKEEKLRRENQAKLKFRGYFGKIEKPAVKKDTTPAETILTPFSVKDGMLLAKPPCKPLDDTAEFDRLVKLQSPDDSMNYIQTCKLLTRKVCHSDRTKPPEPSVDDDSVLMVSEVKRKLPRFKLLQFAGNYRPAYFGTWRKPRGAVNPRNPLKKDEGLLDYEVDSDAEWEEEEPGESISSSEGEDKEAEGDPEDSDSDDGFFVPHGYLSNDEGDCDDSDFIPAPGEDAQETKRKKQLAKAWEAEFARKCQPLAPKLIGCLWLQSGGESPTQQESFLMQFAAVPLVALPVCIPITSKGESSEGLGTGVGSSAANESLKQPVPEEAIPDLIRFIHKSGMGMTKIINTFRVHWGAKVSSSHLPLPSPHPDAQGSAPHPQPGKIDSTPKSTINPFREYANTSGISKRQLEKKIQAIASKEVRLPLSRSVWYVHDAMLKQYGLDQENFTPLVSDAASPLLTPKLPDLQEPPKAILPSPEPGNTVGKLQKRKSSKSLLQFLSRSPLDRSQAQAPSPKRIKLDSVMPLTSLGGETAKEVVDPSPSVPSSANKDSEVIILEPDQALDKPMAKRPCLEETPSKHSTAKEPSSPGADMLVQELLGNSASAVDKVIPKELLTV